MDTEFQIKDTGISKRTGTEIYTKYKDGAWLLYKAFSIRYEGNVNATDHVAPREDTDSTLTHISNEITAVHPPRYTIQGTIVNADAANMKDLEELRRHKGVKRITGGINILSALKDGTDTYDYVEVLITNLTYTENYQNDTTNVNFTLQLKKV